MVAVSEVDPPVGDGVPEYEAVKLRVAETEAVGEVDADEVSE